MREYLKFNKEFKKFLPIFLIILAVVLLMGTSYALLRSSDQGENTYVMNVGLLEVIFIDSETNELTISNAVPMTDSEGMSQSDELIFTVKNTGDFKAQYNVYIEETSTNPAFKTVIRFIANKNDTGYNSPKTLSEDEYIDTGDILDVEETATYKVKLWLLETADNTYMNKTFTARIVIDSYQIDNLDTSGANYPILLDNMIPVYYEATSDTEGVWKKASIENTNAEHQWYDYDNYMWANVVTVKEVGTKTREEYLNASLGTEVNMDDITSMWVWIPRYKYVIFNGNNGAVNEQLIDVVFEHGIDSTGTVACVDNISTSSNSNSSEICTDATNGSIINGVSTYTHPAFTFGGEELTGFWFAKFEMSTDDTACLNNQSSNCNKSAINIYVKPNELSLRYITVSNLFKNTRSMELSGNIHGFSQSNTATTLNNDGTIINDNNNYDIHMEKNMEWGAVSLLSQSQYGKYGNTLYEGDYRRIYRNNYFLATASGSTGGDEMKTGYSGYNEIALNSTTNTVLYNDLTNLGSGKGYKGAGASTTGTIYGIYDMNGGANDCVMMNVVNTSGNFNSLNSGFSSQPSSKYYDKYSYSTIVNTIASRSRSKLGDMIKETLKNINDTTYYAGWGYYGNRNFSRGDAPWLVRGGNASSQIETGVFSTNHSTGNVYSLNSSRPVLAISNSD